jgi:hypothetical protein
MSQPMTSLLRKAAVLCLSAALPLLSTLGIVRAAEPAGLITSLADGAVVSGAAVRVTVDPVGTTDIRKVKFKVDGVLQNKDRTSPFEWTWDTTGVSDGPHVLKARIIDRDGNRSVHAIQVTVNNGAQPKTSETPTSTEPAFQTPESNATVSGTGVPVSLWLPDSDAVLKVKFDIDGELVAEVYNPPFAGNWDSTTVPDGVHTMRARVYDHDYNRTDTEIQVTVANNAAGTTSPAGTSPSGVAPAWAEHAYGALQNYKHLADFWAGRVATDTSTSFFEPGGGWNDDVELSQSLAAYWLLTGDEGLGDMFRLMADSIQEAPYLGSKSAPWTQPDDRRVEQGYGTDKLDVDHSAEETTLVFPRMFYVDFGEPTNVELMTRLIWNFEDDQDAVYPGEENWAQWVDTGMLMRSPRFNARYVDFCWILPEPDDCFAPQDTVNGFRTTAPALSLGWYYGPGHYLWNDGPAGFMKAHHDAWVEATLRHEGDKPSLVPPSKILVDSLGFGDWTVNDAEPYGTGSGWKSGAWVFRHFYHAMIGDSVMLAATGEPEQEDLASNASAVVRNAFSARQNGRLVPVVNASYSLDRQFLQWRAESGYSDDDNVFLSNRVSKNADTQVMGYLINRERDNLAAALDNATQAYRYLEEYLNGKSTEWTTDLTAGQTGLTDQVKFEFSDAFLMAALGGSGIYDGAYPTIYYSLADTAAQVVTLVNERSPEDTSFWAYNFGADREIGLRLWRMAEGVGRVTLGVDADQDGQMEYVTGSIDLPEVRKGDEVRLVLPGGELYLVRVEILDTDARNLAELPDPAVGRKDYWHVDGRAHVRVHNIGLAPTGPVSVRLVDVHGNQIGSAQTLELDGFTGMAPVVQTLTWSVADPNSVARVEVDPADQLQEVTELNNRLAIN